MCEIIAEVGEDGFIEIENRVNADADAEKRGHFGRKCDLLRRGDETL